MTELDLFGKKESVHFVAETVALYKWKNILNDELLDSVKELQIRLSKMTLAEYEVYATLIRKKPQGLSEEK